VFVVKDKAKKPADEGDAANKANKLSAAELRIQKGLFICMACPQCLLQTARHAARK
jgi:hypothetical protein